MAASTLKITREADASPFSPHGSRAFVAADICAYGVYALEARAHEVGGLVVALTA